MTTKALKCGLPPMHPGELLREVVLPGVNKTKTEIAQLMGISRQTLHGILDEKHPVTPAVALRLGKLFGNGPDLWLNLQRQWDIAEAERTVDVSRIPTLTAA